MDLLAKQWSAAVVELAVMLLNAIRLEAAILAQAAVLHANVCCEMLLQVN